MRVNDTYLLSIAYLGVPRDGSDTELTLEGTGFLIEYQTRTYLVTAAHVAMGLRNKDFCVRFTVGDASRVSVQPVRNPSWYFHPTDTIDVAILRYDSPPDGVRALSAKTIVSDFKRESKNFGPGDLAHVVGYFRKLREQHRNVPVVHTGHIASMADHEPLMTRDWRGLPGHEFLEIEGYVVQVQTQPGSSGSPVFVRRSIEAPRIVPIGTGGSHDEDEAPVRVWMHGSMWLLGIWHGGWNDDVSHDLGRLAGTLTLSTGMGICVPASHLQDLLERTDGK